jgi:glycosyltransferase involved in cell wall biosynthesis
MPLISVIITTYNWKEAFANCLESLFQQDDLGFEIIVADDGSRSDTTDLINTFSQKSPVSLKHVYHEDKGFRAAAIRNKAVLESEGDYLIFLDGDCVVFPHFISRHKCFAQRNFFVAGNRILLNQAFTQTVLEQNLPIYKQPILTFLKWRFQNKINRFLPLLYLPFNRFRLLRPNHWENAMTCNLGVWKTDFVAVNGFDESFEGWGYEDSDLVIRLIHYGVKRKEGRFALPVLHLWHKQNDRTNQSANYELLLKRINAVDLVRAESGLIELQNK